MKGVFGDTVASGTSHLIGALAQLVAQVVAVRTLSIEQYGIYVTSLAIVSLLEVSFLNRGNDVALATLTAPWHSNDRDLLRPICRFLVGQDAKWTIFTFLALLCVSYPLEMLVGVSAEILCALALSIPLQTGYGASKAVLILAGHVKHNALFESAFALCASAITIVGVLLFGFWGAVGAVPIAALIKNFAAGIWARRLLPAKRAEHSATRHGFHLDKNESFRSITRNSLVALSEQVDVLLLNAFAGPAAAGVYRIAKSLGSLPARLLGPMWVAYRPRLIGMWQRGELHEMLVAIRKAATVAVLPLVAIGPLMWFFAADIISSVYGEDVLEASMPFCILLYGGWMFHGTTAWYRYLVPVASRQLSSLAAGSFQATVTVLLAALYGRSSPFEMSIAVSLAWVFTAVLCWLLLVRATRKAASTDC